MRLVVGLGGNALLRRGEAPAAETQRRNIEKAVAVGVARLARHELVVTHGNGPQIGLLALQSVSLAASFPAAKPYPLDLLGAESEGMIGYLIALALMNALPRREIATLLTEIEVDPGDPAFRSPKKPIGPLLDEAEAQRVAASKGWKMMRDGSGWRRAVSSPMPRRIRQIRPIELLLGAGVIVVCAGGGGIPIAAGKGGGFYGIEAVIDKDFASALLAETLNADFLLLLTDVRAVWSRWPAADGKPIGRTTPSELSSIAFAEGSMGPKVEAACRFVERTGKKAAIGAVEEAEAILEGAAGTLVEKLRKASPRPRMGRS